MVLSAYMHLNHWTVYTYYCSVVCITGILRESEKNHICVNLQKAAEEVPAIFLLCYSQLSTFYNLCDLC